MLTAQVVTIPLFVSKTAMSTFWQTNHGLKAGGVEVLKPRQTPSPNLMNASPTTPSSLAVAFAVAKGVRFAENSARSLNTMLTTFNAYEGAALYREGAALRLIILQRRKQERQNQELKSNWAKAWYREGAALRLMQACFKFEEAANAFYEGVKLDPENKELVHAFKEAIDAGRAFHGSFGNESYASTKDYSKKEEGASWSDGYQGLTA
ncbi:hypothetical protein LXL04_026999 [Taraxacum kok-saghyz]